MNLYYEILLKLPQNDTFKYFLHTNDTTSTINQANSNFMHWLFSSYILRIYEDLKEQNRTQFDNTYIPNTT